MVEALDQDKDRHAAITGFNHLVSDQKKALRFLLGFCWKNHQRFCPRCRERKVYAIQDGRRRCSRCRYSFHDFSLRFINAVRLDPCSWLWLLKLFELETPPRIACAQLGLSYATTLKAWDTIRRAILAQGLDAPALYAEGLWPGPGRKRPTREMGRPPVFGVITQGGCVFCDVLPDFGAGTLLHFKLKFGLKTAHCAGIVYTAPYHRYETLLTCDPELFASRAIRHDDTGIIADMPGSFWRYAKERLARLRGVAPDKFPLLLKELEFRFNHRDQPLFPALAAAVCSIVPKP